MNLSQTDNPPIPTADASASAGTRPDWEQITRDITCPLCGYNLRGLTHTVCPECGHHFDWPAVLNPDKALHPYLFEHHPERNIQSFLRTILRNNRPFTFWNTVNPNHPTRRGRLLIYWAICGIVSMLPAVLAIGITIQSWLILRRRPATLSSVAHTLVFVLAHDQLIRAIVTACALWAIFPLLNFLALQVFAQSMRRANVKPVHVLRCTIYSGDVILWNALFFAGLMALTEFNTSIRSQSMVILLFSSSIVTMLVNFFRLNAAYRQYMKFNHVVATVFAAQLMVALAILTGLVFVANLFLML